ncbi:cytosolic sulfotransferase 5 [Beta vulgaris subsp. vulgaris]|uniref:cytosolic sulfotransferase 5 n=1 Tax=Beta vulgaris subsp. vulgaris TaxID=3555 RepID=UPI0020366C76|nr:cytosolic sulfotransferase 5 [Beta vulgaris subsp. vulgaris]
MNQNENQRDDEIQEVQEEEVQQLIQCLEKANFMNSKLQLVKYQGFWTSRGGLKNILHYQRHFQAHDSDLIVASLPKTGTTWLISLLFSIVNRVKLEHQPLNKKSPLLHHNPHELVYHLEHGVYGKNPILPNPNQLDELSSPRLFYTHIPYGSLPKSIKASSCKMLYIARNPLDTIVSSYHFYIDFIKKATEDQDFKPPSIEDFFDDFCEGRSMTGPYFEHVVGFWKESLEQPSKVLFLKYEDLKEDPTFYSKKVAEFVGFPFSPREESEGVIDNVSELCSIKKLKELEVNKNGAMNKYVDKKTYFRKGEVGDWTNYFKPLMVDKIHKLMEEKFEGTDLSFKLLPNPQ